MATRLLYAIDPGVTGALAIFEIESGKLIDVLDLPIMRDGTLAWIDTQTLLGQMLEVQAGRLVHAITERVHAMPKNGSQGAFSQGLTLGSILATLSAAGASIELASPSKWKREAGLMTVGRKLSDGERKEVSRSKARMLYPSADLQLKKHHNRAEAILLGHWWMNQRGGVAVAA
jgi:hypothetical protein